MSRLSGRLSCVAALLCGVGAAMASESPTEAALRFDADTLASASDALLDTLRGGFDFGGNLAVSFGFVRSVSINGDLVSQTRFNLPDLSHISADQIKAVSDALAQAQIIQNGPGNSAPGGNLSGGSVATVTTANGNAAPGNAATGSANTANTGAGSPSNNSPSTASPAIPPGPVSISLPSGVLSNASILQNSLNNQLIQSRTVIDAGVNSLSILRSLNIQGALRDALAASLGIH